MAQTYIVLLELERPAKTEHAMLADTLLMCPALYTPFLTEKYILLRRFGAFLRETRHIATCCKWLSYGPRLQKVLSYYCPGSPLHAGLICLNAGLKNKNEH